MDDGDSLPAWQANALAASKTIPASDWPASMNRAMMAAGALVGPHRYWLLRHPRHRLAGPAPVPDRLVIDSRRLAAILLKVQM